MRLLVANRAEVAVRIMRTAADLDIETVAVFSEDDRDALHTRVAAAKVALPGRGPAAYLDGARVIDAAHALHCDAIHPGYGLLSEDAAFAAAVEKAGLCFVGPRSSTLAEWGDKHRALARAESLQVPVLPRTGLLDDVAPAAGLMAEFGSVVLKAVAGGGGRGLRIVEDVAELATALIACREEARRSFASDAVYAERYLRPARHIEVQVLGDGATVRSLGTRDCSLQRRRQKVVEVAPAILPAPVLHSMESAAVRMAEQEGFLGLGTFEFLVSPSHDLYFIECNPRLQVEHTVTEAVTGLDLVALQLYIAQGATLEQLGLSTPPSARGWAMQLRIYAESYDEQGRIQPAGGELREFSEPSGPGVRVDSAVVLGQSINPRFDSLLAKLIVHAPDASSGLRRARRALREFHIDGLATNQGYLNALLARPEIEDWTVFTDLIDGLPLVASKRTDQRAAHAAVPDERGTLQAPLRAEVVAVGAVSGQAVEAGAELVVLEAMKMHHVVAAPTALTVDEVLVS
ncbi:MAG: biotin carboxylase N-terminal domain-containing protein, partial [Myxococcota bacterium]